MKKLKRYQVMLCLSLAVMLVASFIASTIQSGSGKINVQEYKIATGADKYITFLMLVPPNATAQTPAPLIITCHGSYNNKGMQDQNFVEWSRRGYVVIALDAYGHGSSTLGTGASVNYMVHMVEYAYTMFDFIDKDKIGISGHSMGGGTVNTTLQYYLRQEALGLGPNKIAAALYVGMNPTYVDYKLPDVEEPVFPSVSTGIIAGKYDSWFRFADVDNNIFRFLESKNALAFVNQVGAGVTSGVEAGKKYWGEVDGKNLLRVIYRPSELHPQNHFSMESAKYGSDFFLEVFGTPTGAQYINPASQVWQWKEFFNFLGLIGALMFLYPFACLLMETPFFAGLKAAQTPLRAPALQSGKDKIVFWGSYLINLAIPPLLVLPVMFHLVGKGAMLPNKSTSWFGQTNTNELAVWTAIVGVCILLVMLIANFLLKKKGDKMVPQYWGIKISVGEFFKSVLLAVAVVAGLYVIVFMVDFFFVTDFRLWVLALMPFAPDKVVYAIAYVPAFMVFYLVNSIAVGAGNNRENFPQWLVVVISCVSNIGGLATLLFLQYYPLYTTGFTPYNTMRIINLFPLLFLIPAATIVSHFFFKKTGKIYLGSTVMAVLYTLMTCANTMSSASILG